ncbi:MAG: single-stranded DNA-binding protein [Puniceicoccales bacterium]|jgi:single-strand DNA-binding protein|nr:single-stranded DNA-binding protein [Puniceicoccales bacterium]
MASFNKVILMGNLTRDPELRVTQQGMSICKFAVAVSRQAKMADGTMKEETAFIDIDAFGKQGEVIGKYFTKGRPILLEGRLRLDQWENQSGEKRSKLGVVLENFQFVGTRADAEEGGAALSQNVAESHQEPVDRLVEDLSQNKEIKNKPVYTNVQLDEDVPF